jgi:hypothetical protein
MVGENYQGLKKPHSFFSSRKEKRAMSWGQAMLQEPSGKDGCDDINSPAVRHFLSGLGSWREDLDGIDRGSARGKLLFRWHWLWRGGGSFLFENIG